MIAPWAGSVSPSPLSTTVVVPSGPASDHVVPPSSPPEVASIFRHDKEAGMRAFVRTPKLGFSVEPLTVALKVGFGSGSW